MKWATGKSRWFLGSIPDATLMSAIDGVPVMANTDGVERMTEITDFIESSATEDDA